MAKIRFPKRQAVALVLPLAVAWVNRQESLILRYGAGLAPDEISVAKRLGVAAPERVRALAVESVPPTNSLVRRVGELLGFMSPHIIGMALGHGILVRKEHWGERRLIVHELAHVAQYERLGGAKEFLRQYLSECLDPGYPLGPLEQEARRAERAACAS